MSNKKEKEINLEKEIIKAILGLSAYETSVDDGQIHAENQHLILCGQFGLKPDHFKQEKCAGIYLDLCSNKGIHSDIASQFKEEIGKISLDGKTREDFTRIPIQHCIEELLEEHNLAKRSNLKAELMTAEDVGEEEKILDALEALRSSERKKKALKSILEPYNLQDASNDLLRLDEGLETGYSQLDKYIKIMPAGITLITGQSGHGKTNLMLNLSAHWLRCTDRKIFFFTYEEPKYRLLAKLLTILSDWTNVFTEQELKGYKTHPFSQILKMLKDKRLIGGLDTLSLNGGQKKALELIDRMYFSDDYLTDADLGTQLQHISKKDDNAIIFIDYIQKIPTKNSQSQRYLEMQEVSRTLLKTAIETRLTLIAGSQLNKDGETREAMDITQDATLILQMEQDKMELEQHRLQITKNRYNPPNSKPFVLRRKGIKFILAENG